MSTIIVDESQVQLVESNTPPEVIILTGEVLTSVVQTTVQEIVVTEQEAEAVIIEIDGREVVVTQEDPVVNLLTVGTQGPQGIQGVQGIQGPPGIMEEDMPYAKKVDFIGDVIFTGKAAVGSLGTDDVWQISKTEFASDDDIEVTWANGTAAFDKVWDDRNTYTYE